MPESVDELDNSVLARMTGRSDIDDMLRVTLELSDKPTERGSFTVSAGDTSALREIVLLGNLARLSSNNSDRNFAVYRDHEFGSSATFAAVGFNSKNNAGGAKVTFTTLIRGLTKKDHLKLISSDAPQGFTRLAVEKWINNKLELIHESKNLSGLSHDIELDWP